MSKVICDVCGTTYPDTSAQCPICGSARKSVNQTGADSTGEGSSYTYVRGGRFSKSNVRKRNRTGQDFERRPAAGQPKPKAQEAAQPARRAPQPRQEDDSVTVNKGLIVVVIILLLAIIAVTAYICVKFILPGGETPSKPNKDNRPGTTTVAPQPSDPTEARIPCESLTLSGSTIEFTNAGDSWLLSAEKDPVDSTDEIVFSSSDEAVATVSQTGLITAVNYGQAVITVTCGDATAQCTVVCSFGTPPETTQPTEPVDPNFTFEFNTRWIDEDSGKYDTTIDGAGKTWRAYKNNLSVDPADITWTVDDPSICTIENGIVTAVARGKTEIHAQYGGKTYTCIVRCNWVEETEPTEPEVTEPTEPAEPSEPTEPSKPGDTTEPTEPEEGGETAAVSISHTDVTLHISSDKSFTLRLKDAEGNTLEVEWTAEDPTFVTIEGNKITGIAVGTTNVSCTYEGVTYTCIVRVYE